MGISRAYLSLCAKCGHHGHIVCADGKEGHEFVTVQGGLKQLTNLQLSGEVGADEAMRITQWIKESGLECRNDEVEAVLEGRGKKQSWLGEIFDEFHRELHGIPARKVETKWDGERRTLH